MVVRLCSTDSMSDTTPGTWYVTSPGKEPTGPHSTAEVVGAIHLRQLGPGTHVRASDADPWQPLETVSPFAAVVAGLQQSSAGVAPAIVPPTNQTSFLPKGPLGWIAVGALGLVALNEWGSAAWLLITGKPPSKAPPAATATVQAEPASTIDPATKALADFIASLGEEKTLGGAIFKTKRLMKDKHNASDDGADLLVNWMSTHGLNWLELHNMPETSIPKMKKDPDAERGKRICISGTIVEIQRTNGVFAGNIINDAVEVVTFLAAGDTGNLVGNSTAKFCGIATGLFSYSNTAGGTTNAVRVAGAFDLPSNKPATKPR